MSATLAVDATGATGVAGDEFEPLDMRVVESTTPLVEMMCSTDDGCGVSCGTSACSTGSNDPS
ncbi:FxLD family lanthipeptide [Nonomuraea aridisoli]|uniref:FxLD family lantipeptide n=1 Tax=Nonomuraea aridisoli TaxID=2070368 RepID=A0A2W2E626_9ACTN|nr:FxLD family lanthipeptide [Nonomuraea aridisoli]PZG18013.1 FxLD family lantipeptide [Nonomuraea aridisoli]